MTTKPSPTPPLLEVLEKNLGRVTGWVVVCRECGAFPTALQSREAGRSLAIDHRAKEHRGEGLIRVRGARSKPRGKGRRRAA